MILIVRTALFMDGEIESAKASSPQEARRIKKEMEQRALPDEIVLTYPPLSPSPRWSEKG